ncbi:baseplate wedge subunit [Pseudomonas phage vB_PpuM-Aura]
MAITVLYSDLSNDPLSGLPLQFNESAVYQALDNLMNTGQKQRLFRPDIDPDLRDLLFEPINSDTASMIMAHFVGGIQKYEPRLRLDMKSSSVIPYMDAQMYYVQLNFYIQGLDGNYSVGGDLKRPAS